MKRNSILLSSILLIASAGQAWPQSNVQLVPVVSRTLSRTVDLPGEFAPFLTVSLLAELTAPEMQARIAEAEYRVQSAEADQAQAEAQLAASQAVSERLKKASETPGAVAGNELIQAGKQVEAAQALVRSREQASRAAEATLRTEKDLAAYLRITAPFDGVVSDRLVHPGALVGPGNDAPLLVLQQISHLRLVVPVPEADTGGIAS